MNKKGQDYLFVIMKTRVEIMIALQEEVGVINLSKRFQLT